MVAGGGRVRPHDLVRVTTLHPEGDADAVVLDVVGEVDLHSSPVLEGAIAEAQAGSPSLLVIDLTGVSFMASIGITLLLNASRDAGPRGRVRVVAPKVGPVGRTLELTGVAEALGVAVSRSEALTR